MASDGAGGTRSEIAVGTRGSVLARWQAEHVVELLRKARPDLALRLEIVRTEGDKRQDVPFSAFPTRGVFVRELESALLERRIDLAVHSAKDVPTEQPEGLTLAATLPRDDPRDALIGRRLADLPRGARVGTGSPRRRAGLARLRPDLVFEDLRGNVDTRLRKLDEGRFDAIVLSCAGIDRLGLSRRIAERLDPASCPPAPGQGVVVVEARADDDAVRGALEAIGSPDSMRCLAAERALLRALGGGCQVPIGALATVESGLLSILASVTSVDGRRSIADSARGDPSNADGIGRKLGERMLEAGAGEILKAGRR